MTVPDVSIREEVTYHCRCNRCRRTTVLYDRLTAEQWARTHECVAVDDVR